MAVLGRFLRQRGRIQKKRNRRPCTATVRYVVGEWSKTKEKTGAQIRATGVYLCGRTLLRSGMPRRTRKVAPRTLPRQHASSCTTTFTAASPGGLRPRDDE